MPKTNNMTNITTTKTTLTVSAGKLDKSEIGEEINKFINNFNCNELDSNFIPNATKIILNKKPSDTFVIIM